MDQAVAIRELKMRRLEAEALSSMFVRLEICNAEHVAGIYAVSDIQELRIVRSRTFGGAFEVLRRQSHIRHPSDSAIFICLPIFGETSIHQNGRKSVLTKGNFGVLNSRIGYQIDFAARTDTLWIRIPAEPMEARLRDFPAILAQKIDGSKGMGLVAATFLRSLASEVSTFGGQVAAPLSSITADLVSAAAAEERQSVSFRHLSTGRKTLDRARQFIECHIQNEQLTPTHIAKGVGISNRYLSQLFAAEGTSTMEWVTRRRLDLVKNVLQQQHWTPGLVTEVAFKYGFNSIPSFNRSFKKMFGKSPRQLTRMYAERRIDTLPRSYN